ncbi:transcription factor TCP2-like [Salvia miltiorrhiza]|uniref:transcription factor TCP2-like n=1 Tax=Salvia miltiorrhiza TaxID=226208 RepID=UPI0025AC6ABD|nr:transcription factor TCP2-like [Salvia miltiorrhiza]
MKRPNATGGGVHNDDVDLGGGVGRFYGWPSSRIVRVSRAFGGKDRHNKSSKAVEWLLKATTSSIEELSPMNTLFPDTPKQLSDEKRSSTAGSDQLCFDSAEIDLDGSGDPNYSQQQQVTKSSACSSTSETNKGSGLSLSRSKSRIKARKRAK